MYRNLQKNGKEKIKMLYYDIVINFMIYEKKYIYNNNR